MPRWAGLIEERSYEQATRAGDPGIHADCEGRRCW
jgi:hypothetical protein